MSREESSVKSLYNDHKPLAKSFTQVSNALLNNAYRVRKWQPDQGEDPETFKPEGLSSSELLWVIHALKFKRTRLTSLSSGHAAKCLGISQPSVRRLVRKLTRDRLINARYDAKTDKYAYYDLEPLFQRINEILEWEKEQDISSREVN